MWLITQSIAFSLKKKIILLNHSKSLSLLWVFIPFSPKPSLCVSVFYLWGRLLSRASLCGVVPVLPSSFYYLPSEYVLHKDITFLLFCCLLVVSFVCLFETRSQVAKAVSKFPWPGNPDSPASLLGLQVCSGAKHPFVLSLLVFPALSWVSDGDKNALPSGYPRLCDCWLKTEAEVTVIRMKPSAWPPKKHMGYLLQGLLPSGLLQTKEWVMASLRSLQASWWADSVLLSALVIWQVFSEAGPGANFELSTDIARLPRGNQNQG